MPAQATARVVREAGKFAMGEFHRGISESRGRIREVLFLALGPWDFDLDVNIVNQSLKSQQGIACRNSEWSRLACKQIQHDSHIPAQRPRQVGEGDTGRRAQLEDQRTREGGSFCRARPNHL